MAKKLVIVESPSKAKTIEKILGKGYEVEASYGHVIDLPKTKIGVDIENKFEPHYQVIKGKGEVLKKLKDKAKKADAVFLASDMDREGEAIAWHISNYIKVPDKTKRIEFNEITKTAINNAIKHPRNIDENLVNAQQARRVLDRIVGYKISPLLWKIISKNASAGRVQSVALKLVCDLEDEIRGFIPQKYWEVSVLTDQGIELGIYEIASEKTDRIFDDKIMKKLKKDLDKKNLTVFKIKVSKKTQKPPLVFKTSTLQQLASSYLGYATNKTMRVAQQLYEGLSIDGENVGLITYMRTDSTRVSNDSMDDARKYIEKNFGKEYVGKYVPAKGKGNVQDAHEGIRPTDITLEPDRLKDSLSSEQYRLYKLIWERFLVSQFSSMKYDQMQINAQNGDYIFRGTINKVTFDGYYKIFKDEDEIKTADFPEIKEGDELHVKELKIKEGITKPPARYSEASLVKKLESEGIGRPSTYASIIETLKSRNYAEIVDKRFIPTVLGYEVKTELERHFNQIMNIKFTANMEEELDGIESGEIKWVELLSKFYADLEKDLNKFEKEIQELQDRRIEADIMCANGTEAMILKTGRFGKYLICESNTEEKVSLKGVPIPKEEIEAGKIIVKEKVEAVEAEKRGVPTDHYTKDGARLFVKKGRFGEYLESENYETDEIRMPLPYKVKLELKKGKSRVEDGVFIIHEELEKMINEDQQIITEAGLCEKCGKPFEIKIGRFGRFLACTGYPDCKNIKKIPKKQEK